MAFGGSRGGSGGLATPKRRRVHSFLQRGIAVALLLGASGLLSALFAAIASQRIGAADHTWEVSSLSDAHRASGVEFALEHVYADEGPVALDVVKSRVLSKVMKSASAHDPPDVQAVLTTEAFAQSQQAAEEANSVGLTSDWRYALPDGAFDVEGRLRDALRSYPADAVLNPQRWFNEGDKQSHQAVRILEATVPLGVAFLLGAIARVFPPVRSRLVGGGALLLMASGCYGLMVIAGVI